MRSKRYDMVAGLAAVALALGVAELAAGLLGGSSLVIAVGNVVIDNTPGPLVKRIINLLGTNDKPALILGITVTSLALGAVLGPAAGRSRNVAAMAFVVFGAAGALAGIADPLTGAVVAIATAVLAAAVGYLVLDLLLRTAPGAATAPGDGAPSGAVMPGRGVADRRRFLAFAGGATGAAAVAAVAGRTLLGDSVNVEEQRRTLTLPTVRGGGSLVVREDAGFQQPGLSPLITPNKDFYRIDTALVVPRVDVTTWRLRINGMVDAPYELTFDELAEMASIQESATLVCVSNEVGGRLAGNAIWLGAPLVQILERAGVQDGATQIIGRSVDGFTVGFPTEVALDGRPAMVAIGMNGEPLPAQHGFPARLVVPGLYGYVSATKWLSEIELTTLEDEDGYWIPRGWAKEAPIKTHSRIDVPRNQQKIDSSAVAGGPVAVAGVAWGGYRSVERVEVRILPASDAEDLVDSASGEDAPGSDSVGEWVEARLSAALTRSSWRQWVVEWDATPGEYRIEVRATDGEGDTQTARRQQPAPDGATGYHRVWVTVRA